MDLKPRIEALYVDLEGAKGNASWATSSIFNALLEEIKGQHGDDPVVATMEPVEEGSMSGTSTSSNESLRIATGQLLAVAKGE